MAKRIVFKPHLVQEPNTYTIQDNGDGTHTLVPATGTVLQQGTPLSSENLNNTEQEMLLTVFDLSGNPNQIAVSIEGITTAEDIPNNLLVQVLGDVTGEVTLVVMDENMTTIAEYTVIIIRETGSDWLREETLYSQSYALFALNHTLYTATLASAPVSGVIKSDGSVQMEVDYVPTADQDVATKKYVDDNVAGDNPEFESVKFVNTSNPPWSEGLVFYDNQRKALSYYNDNSEVTVNIAQEFLRPIINKTGQVIPNGTIVYPSGVDVATGRYTVELADARYRDKSLIVGVTTSTLGINGTGYVTTDGTVSGLNTSSFTEGEVLYLDENNPGQLTTTYPTDGSFLVIIGVCRTSDLSNGEIEVDRVVSQYTVETNDINGFPYNHQEDVMVTYVNATRTLTLTANNSNQDFHFYVFGEKFEKFGPQSIVWSNTVGNHYFYYDGNGDLQELVDPTPVQIGQIFIGECAVAYGYWNGTEMVNGIGYELHGMNMPPSVHSYLHRYRNATYFSGGTPSGYTVDGSGNLESDGQVQISAVLYSDEDIDHTTVEYAVTDNMPIYYLTGSDSAPTLNVKDSITGYLTTRFNGTGLAEYNELVGGTWQLSEVSSGNYFLAHTIATNYIDENDQTKRKLSVLMGQNEYANKTLARAGANVEISQLRSTLPFPEIVILHTWIFQTASNKNNAGKVEIVSTDTGDDYIDWREKTLTAYGGTIGGSHLDLADTNAPNSHPLSAIENTNTGTYVWLTGTDGQTAVDQIASKINSLTDDFLQKTGGTMTGTIVMDPQGVSGQDWNSHVIQFRAWDQSLTSYSVADLSLDAQGDLYLNSDKLLTESANKYLASVSGTGDDSNVVFTLSDSSEVYWNSRHTHSEYLLNTSDSFDGTLSFEIDGIANDADSHGILFKAILNGVPTSMLFYGAGSLTSSKAIPMWGTYQIWTSDDITLADISNWDTAYSWGDHTGLYLGISDTAANSNQLGGYTSSQFLRSDINDIMSAILTMDSTLKMGKVGSGSNEVSNKIEWEGRAADTTYTVDMYLSTTAQLMFGNNEIYHQGNLSIPDNTDYVDLTTNQTVGGNKTFSGETIFNGNVTMNGTTHIVNSNTVEIGDNIMLLNSDETGTPSQNAGFEIERGTSANVQFVWDETYDMFSTVNQKLETKGYLVNGANDAVNILSVGSATSSTAFGFYWKYRGDLSGTANGMEFWTDGGGIGSGDDIKVWETDQYGVMNFTEYPEVAGTALNNLFLGITDKASNSDKLDSLDSTQFLRSDIADTMGAQLTMDADLKIAPIGTSSTENSNSIIWAGRAVDSEFTLEMYMTSLGALMYGSNEIYHEGHKPTATEVGALPFDGTFVSGNTAFYGTSTLTYSTAPIEIREVNLVGSGQSSDSYAPGIGFLWNNRHGKVLLMDANGKLKWDGYEVYNTNNIPDYLLSSEMTDHSLNPKFYVSIGMGNDSEVIYFNDNTNQSRTDYWTNKDGFEIRGDSNSKANVVVQTGNIEVDNNMHVGGKIGTPEVVIQDSSEIDQVSIVYNTTRKSIQFKF